jgi:thiamine transporter
MSILDYIKGVFSEVSGITIQSWACIIGLIAAALLLSRVLSRKKRINTRTLTYGSVCIALSFILSFIKFYHWPQGGSITPGSMLPLIIFAFVFGPVPGILAGMVYGVLQLIQDPYILQIVQVLFDYPLAFGAIGLAGYFKNNFTMAIISAGLGRLFFAFLSGVFFFASYAPAGMNPAVYSIAVNGINIGAEIVICLIISAVPQMRPALQRMKQQALSAS